MFFAFGHKKHQSCNKQPICSLLEYEKQHICAAHEESFPFNPVNTPSLFYYGPLNYYFAGQFDKAFEFIDKRIEIAKGSEARIIERYGSLDDEDTEDRRTYEAMHKNLKQWIAERRQFKIDDEYLPHF